jgi:GTP-binding protein
MSSTLACSRLLSSTLTPFLYPCLDSSWSAATSRLAPRFRLAGNRHSTRRWQTTTTTENAEPSRDVTQYDHLNPQPSDYSETPFTDACTLTVAAGNGGHGCISFLREKYVPDGPPNGGDGGTGGSIYIQAVRGETSLHKLARRGTIKADRGRNGQGTSKGGKRGEDILLTVPVGTVIRDETIEGKSGFCTLPPFLITSMQKTSRLCHLLAAMFSPCQSLADPFVWISTSPWKSQCCSPLVQSAVWAILTS